MARQAAVAWTTSALQNAAEKLEQGAASPTYSRRRAKASAPAQVRHGSETAVFARHGALFKSQQRPETAGVQVAADTREALQLYSTGSCCSVQQTCEL